MSTERKTVEHNNLQSEDSHVYFRVSVFSSTVAYLLYDTWRVIPVKPNNTFRLSALYETAYYDLFRLTISSIISLTTRHVV